MDIGLVTRRDHAIRIEQCQRHRLLDDDVLLVGRKLEDVCSVRPALGEHDDDVDRRLSHHLVHVGEVRHAELLADRPRAVGPDVTDGRQARVGDLPVAQQFGMPLRDAAAADQAKIEGFHFFSSG